MSRSDPPKEGSVVSIIAHDVDRTKMMHPIFENGGQGLGMLKRVLLRCAELGAVKEAGYIQVRWMERLSSSLEVEDT